jgi:Helix-turn-helix
MQPVPTEWAPILRTARLLLGKTVRNVSKESGLPVWRLNAFEQGLSAPAPEEFWRIWRALSTDPPTR